MSVRAVVVDPDSPDGLGLADVGDPSPGPGDIVIDAHHVSLNRGDLDDLRSGRLPRGSVLGRDVAGVVVRAARDREGPPVGARVVALAAGAFARRVAVDVDAVAEVPDGMDLAEAATLPTAGVAAIQALRLGTLEMPVKGARVLITGASGGVGRFAVQLAAYAGGHVIAVAGRSGSAEELAALGAEQVVADPGEIDEPVDLVLDMVGGAHLVTAWRLLAAGGSVQCVGWSCGEPATLPPYATVGPAKSLTSFLITAPVTTDLTNLVRLLEDGSLRAKIGWRGPLARIGEATQALAARHISGKAVLDLVPRRRTASAERAMGARGQ